MTKVTPADFVDTTLPHEYTELKLKICDALLERKATEGGMAFRC